MPVGEEGEVRGGHAGRVDQDDLGGDRLVGRAGRDDALGDHDLVALRVGRRASTSARCSCCRRRRAVQHQGVLVARCPATAVGPWSKKRAAAVGRAGVLELAVGEAGAPARSRRPGGRAGRRSCRRRRASTCGADAGRDAGLRPPPGRRASAGRPARRGAAPRRAGPSSRPGCRRRRCRRRPSARPGRAGRAARGAGPPRERRVADISPAALPGAPGEPAGAPRGRAAGSPSWTARKAMPISGTSA